MLVATSLQPVLKWHDGALGLATILVQLARLLDPVNGRWQRGTVVASRTSRLYPLGPVRVTRERPTSVTFKRFQEENPSRRGNRSVTQAKLANVPLPWC